MSIEGNQGNNRNENRIMYKLPVNEERKAINKLVVSLPPVRDLNVYQTIMEGQKSW